MPSIFISYRRDDAKADARGLRDRLAGHFGAKRVFMDVDNLLIGQRFDLELEKALDTCDVFLAIMGPRWIELLSERRASGERDYVREEIAAALKRGNIVIPVLVDDAKLPQADALPEELRELVLYQAHSVSHNSYGRDVFDLIEGIETQTGGGTRVGKVFGAVLFVGLLAAFAGYLAYVGYIFSDAEPEVSVDRTKIEVAKKADAQRKFEEKTKAELVRKAEEKRKAELARKKKRVPYEPEMVRIPGGSFRMGCISGKRCKDNEKPVHRVTIKSFEMGKYEVTRGQFRTFVKATGHQTKGGCHIWISYEWKKHSDKSWLSPGFTQDDTHPVICVNWQDVRAYTKWLSSKTGKTYRLPSEAEWEYAARAKTSSPFSFKGKISTSKANYNGNYTFDGSAKGKLRQKTVPVRSFAPNPFGLYNVHGNVWEWVQDCWNENYEGAPVDSKAWTTGDCNRRVVRGGSWNNDPRYLRSAGRYRYASVYRNYGNVGFRLSRTLER